MAVTCANCGEELLGAVNRCWRCGQKFEEPQLSDLPPQRAVLVTDVVTAELVAAVPTGAETATEEAATAESVRRGSPFVDGAAIERVEAPIPKMSPTKVAPAAAGTVTIDESSNRDHRWRSREPLPDHAAIGGAYAAMALGVFSIVVSLLHYSGGLIAVLAIAMGIWGLRSPRRNMALLGMLLAALAMALASYQAAHAIFVYRNQVSPWVETEEGENAINP